MHRDIKPANLLLASVETWDLMIEFDTIVLYRKWCATHPNGSQKQEFTSLHYFRLTCRSHAPLAWFRSQVYFVHALFFYFILESHTYRSVALGEISGCNSTGTLWHLDLHIYNKSLRNGQVDFERCFALSLHGQQMTPSNYYHFWVQKQWTWHGSPKMWHGKLCRSPSCGLWGCRDLPGVSERNLGWKAGGFSLCAVQPKGPLQLDHWCEQTMNAINLIQNYCVQCQCSSYSLFIGCPRLPSSASVGGVRSIWNPGVVFRFQS